MVEGVCRKIVNGEKNLKSKWLEMSNRQNNSNIKASMAVLPTNQDELLSIKVTTWLTLLFQSVMQRNDQFISLDQITDTSLTTRSLRTIFCKYIIHLYAESLRRYIPI